jgi:hypothetical protein
MDIFMMAIFSGKERTQSEFEELVEAQGLTIAAIYTSKTGLSIIEVVKKKAKVICN